MVLLTHSRFLLNGENHPFSVLIMNRAPRITDELLTEIQRDASVAERTVYRRLLGLPVRGRARGRVDRVLAERGVIVADTAEAGHDAR